MTIQRNRAEGWKYAKLSGHENENLVKELFSDKCTFQAKFLERLGKSNCKILKVEVGGLNEKNVVSVLGNTTKSKTDLKVFFNDGTVFNISIKKSLGGQVYLISIHNFILGYEKQFDEVIPEDVKRAIELYWGKANDTLDIVNKLGTNKAYETRKNRLVADTLKAYDKHLYECLLDWFKNNISNLVTFCFASGLAKDRNEWANVIWYDNELGENSVDDLFLISDLQKYFESIAETETYYGNRGHGSTIQLPFGFVQWHSPKKIIPGCIQFHHSYEKLAKSKKKKND